MKSNNFIQRSILITLTFFKDSILSQEYANLGGFLQSLHPRIKLIVFLLFIILALLTRSISALLFFYALCLFLALVSKIKLSFFLMRTWVFIPLFTLFIAIPALFSSFSPGEAIFIWNIFNVSIIITRQGLDSALIFVMRVVVSVSFIVLLNITTKHFELLKSLRCLGIPSIFVMTLGMCYRYLYLFVEIIQNTYLAIKSRVGTLVHYKSGQRVVSWNIASLWKRSVQLNEEVYKAMLSRGYHE